MSDWKIVVPEETENFVQNPSGEIAGNFAAAGGGTITRVTTASKWGLYSYRVQTAANNQGASFTLEALTNNIHYVTMRVAGTLPTAWDWSLDNVNYTAPALLETIDGTWSLYGLQFPAAQANASTTLYVRQNGAGAGDFNLDGLQCEQKEYWTTYADGTQVGCEWEGTEDGSTTRRSALSRGGGRVRDFQDDYYFQISDVIGADAYPQTDNLDSYAIIPGAALNSIKINARPITFIGTLTASTTTQLRDRMQDLINLVSHEGFPEDENGIQPVRIRYTGATVQKEIELHYEAGLEGRQTWRDPECWERVAGLRFLAPNPDWMEIGETSVKLNQRTTTANVIYEFTGRLRETEVGFSGADTPWNDLSVSASPSTGEVLCSVVGTDKRVYIGGSFTNWDGNAGSDYVAVYDPTTQTWSNLGGASDFNGTVYALVFGIDGTLYAGGAFTNVAGDANADYVAEWDGSNWSAVSGGGTADVRALSVGLTGILYIGGTFTNWNAIAAADYMVQWNGSSYSAMDTGTPSACYALATHPNGNIYAGGGVASTSGYIEYWDGSSWTSITSDSISEDITRTIAITGAGTIYAAGDWPDFTVVPPGAQNEPYHIAIYTGSSWETIGGGVYNATGTGNEHFGDVRKIAIGADERIWLVGNFRYVGASQSDIDNGLAVFTGNNIVRPGWDSGTGITFDGLSIGATDPVIEQSYDVYTGFDSFGFGLVSANTDVQNSGSAVAFPKIIIRNESSGSSIPIHIRNESSGDVIYFIDFTLVSGEVLTIDLTQANKTYTSNFRGSVPWALSTDSNTGTWSLLANRTNTINTHVTGTPLADIVVYVLYRTPYKSYS